MIASYVVQRLFQLVPVLFLVSIGIFLIIQLIPGDPVMVMLGATPETSGNINRQQYEELRHQLGFDQPLPIRYLNWVSKVVRGDLGMSLKSRRPVLETLLERYPATIFLAITALIGAVIVAVPAGIIAAVRQNTWVDYLAMGFSLWGVAMPNFWLALMLIVLFSINLGWLPSIGYTSPLVQPVDFLRHAFMPAIVLGASTSAHLTRYLRAEMLEQLSQDYVRAARARGLPPLVVIVKHAAKNSLLAVVTVVGLQTARLLGGSAIVETIFSWPGVASLLLEGIYARDYPIVQGAVLILALTYVFINLVVDVAYKFLDPRVRLE
ncbi:MAG: transporter permease [Chloroflexi bacterium]|nr:transporter permease [Chloroflexota bacterium]